MDFRSETIKHLKMLNIPLDVDFSLQDIQMAYKLMSKLYHPDLNKATNSGAIMVMINLAYEFIQENFNEIKNLRLHLSSNSYGYNNNSYQNTAEEAERRRQTEEAERRRKAAEEAERRRQAEEAEQRRKVAEEAERRRQSRKRMVLEFKKKTILFLIKFIKPIIISMLVIAAILVINYTLFTSKITFETFGGDNVDSIDYYIADQIDSLPTPSKEGHTFQGWYDDPGLSANRVTSIKRGMIGGATLYAKWTINQYSISFESNGGTVFTSITQDYATVTGEPIEPKKKGYTFDGWYVDSSLTVPYEFSTMPAENVTLYAKWDPIQNSITYVINNGESNLVVSGFSGSVFSLNTPVFEGHSFDGWYIDEDLTILYKEIFFPTSDITLYAKWVINQYTINFDSNGGNLLSSITQDYGTTILKPENPTRDGYTFVGWNQDIPSFMPAENLELVAIWNPISYDIEYQLFGGTNNNKNPIIYTVETPNIILEMPTKEGHSFLGWYDNEDHLGTSVDIIAIGSTGKKVLYAKWAINQYLIQFDTQDGTVIPSIIQDYNTPITAPITPFREGYTFIGWDTTFPEYMPANNLIIKANWVINEYIITYITNGGINLNSDTFDYDETIQLPTPKYSGYAFIGWYTDVNLEEYFVLDKMPANDIVLYARWFTTSNLHLRNENYDNELFNADLAYNQYTGYTYTYSGWFFVKPQLAGYRRLYVNNDYPSRSNSQTSGYNYNKQSQFIVSRVVGTIYIELVLKDENDNLVTPTNGYYYFEANQIYTYQVKVTGYVYGDYSGVVYLYLTGKSQRYAGQP